MTTFIKIYGERNTGTNYVSALVALNLAATQVPGGIPPGVRRIHRALPGHQWVRDLYFACTHRRNLGWKHCVPDPGERRLHTWKGEPGALVFVTLTKNPYAWLLSLHRRPYHPAHPRGLDFLTFLQTPWRTFGRDNMGRARLASPVELWNAKNRAYLALARTTTLNATTESILRDPRAFIDRIADDFGVGRSERYFCNHETSTKDRTKDFHHYQDYYLNERWKDKLTAAAVRTINAILDHGLAARYGYEIL